MELLLLIVLVVVALVVFGNRARPAGFTRRPRSRVVNETVYEDDPVVVEEVVERPVSRNRRIVDY